MSPTAGAALAVVEHLKEINFDFTEQQTETAKKAAVDAEARIESDNEMSLRILRMCVRSS